MINIERSWVGRQKSFGNFCIACHSLTYKKFRKLARKRAINVRVASPLVFFSVDLYVRFVLYFANFGTLMPAALECLMSIYQLRSYKRTFERFLFSRLLFAIVYISPIEDLHYSRLTPFNDSYPNDLRFETSFRFSKSQPSKHLNADFVSNLSANCALGYVASSSCDNYHRLGHSSECLAPTSIGEHPWNWQTRGN